MGDTSFYKRELPAGLVAFSSVEGVQLFALALQEVWCIHACPGGVCVVTGFPCPWVHVCTYTHVFMCMCVSVFVCVFPVAQGHMKQYFRLAEQFLTQNEPACELPDRL